MTSHIEHHLTPFNSIENKLSPSGLGKVQLLLLASMFLVGAQQISVFFGSPVAIVGRWIGVGLLVIVCSMGILRKDILVILPVRWVVFLYVWISWQLLILTYHDHSLLRITEERLAGYVVLISGVGILTYCGSRAKALTLLNRTYFFLNLVLVLMSGFFLFGSNTFGASRFTGVFRDPNYMSWAAVNVFLALSFYTFDERFQRASIWIRILSVAILAVSLLILLATGSRDSIFAGLVVFLLLNPSKGVSRAFLKPMLVGLFIGLLFFQYSEQLPALLRIQFQSEEIDVRKLSGGRSEIFYDSLAELREHPERLFIGTGSRGIRYGSLVRPAEWHDPLARLHSDGIFGYILYLIFLLALVASSYETVRSKSETVWGSTVTTVWLSRMILTSFVDSNLIIGHMDYLYFWLVAGCLIAQLREKHKPTILAVQKHATRD